MKKILFLRTVDIFQCRKESFSVKLDKSNTPSSVMIFHFSLTHYDFTLALRSRYRKTLHCSDRFISIGCYSDRLYSRRCYSIRYIS